MKIILSRKGFDSSSGGVPSPIFDDGQMISLPIPASQSPISYCDIDSRVGNIGDIVETLTSGRTNKNSGAHLDPDLERNALSRDEGWKPIFGQVGQAQGHLRNQGVGIGDLFLFYGWFRDVIGQGKNFSYQTGGVDKHVIWGWLQIGEIDVIDQMNPDEKKWARYHPHFHQSRSSSNTLYTSKAKLSIEGHTSTDIVGAGVFPKYHDSLLLTDKESNNRSIWKLPQWFYSSSQREALSFHTDFSRWSKHDGYVNLQTVGRGQEFVLDTKYYPEVIDWAVNKLLLS